MQTKNEAVVATRSSKCKSKFVFLMRSSVVLDILGGLFCNMDYVCISGIYHFLIGIKLQITTVTFKAIMDCKKTRAYKNLF